MKISNNNFNQNDFVILHNQEWLEKQRIAGKVVAGILTILEKEVYNKTSLDLLQLDHLVEQYILDNHCIPTFKNYHGFPNSCCFSVNQQLVHGIPKNYSLQEGDLISFDLGATYQGAIADSAITCIYGEAKCLEHKHLIQTTKECLSKAIEAIKIGEHLGVIGNAIYKHAKKNGFNVITNYGGHGLNYNIPHASPFVANKSEINDGIRIQPGLTIAIEPLLVIGDNYTHTSSDGWTVITSGMSAHEEHSIYVHENNVEIITQRN